MKNNIFGLEMPFDVISAAFASTVAVGGIIGYVKASQCPHSSPSYLQL